MSQPRGPRGLFHGDPAPTHRAYSKFKESTRQHSFNRDAFFAKMAPRVDCSECGAKSGEPCTSRSVKNPGQPLKGCHYQRVGLAKKHFGKKNP